MNIYNKQEPVPFERLLNFFSSESIKKTCISSIKRDTRVIYDFSAFLVLNCPLAGINVKKDSCIAKEQLLLLIELTSWEVSKFLDLPETSGLLADAALQNGDHG